MKLARESGGSEGEKVVKGGGEGGGGEEVEVDGRSGLGAGGLGSQRGGRGVWRVETLALIPIVRPERRRRERERDDLERRFLLYPMARQDGALL